MSSFRVNNPFAAFEREYKRGDVLQAADFECWQPDEDRIAEMSLRRCRGDLEAVSIDDAAGGYPPTWGAGAAPAPAEKEDQVETSTAIADRAE